MAATLGHARAVSIGASGGAASQALLFNTCSVGKRLSHVETEETPGSRFKRAEGVSDGTIAVDGTITLPGRADELSNIMSYVIGGAKTGSDPYTFAQTETLPTLVLEVDKHLSSDSFKYDVCKVNRAVFASDSASQTLQVSLDIEGTADETDGNTYPTLTLSSQRPLLHRQLMFTLSGVNYEVSRLEVEINNNLITDRFLNNQVRTELPEGMVQIIVRINAPFIAANKSAFYEKAVTGFTGVNTAKWTRGTAAVLFTFGALQRPETGVSLTGRESEVDWDLEFEVRHDFTNAVNAIAATIDVT